MMNDLLYVSYANEQLQTKEKLNNHEELKKDPWKWISLEQGGSYLNVDFIQCQFTTSAIDSRHVSAESTI